MINTSLDLVPVRFKILHFDIAKKIWVFFSQNLFEMK